MAAPRWTAGSYQTAALHIITVGALGTLTLNVMAMTWTLNARQHPSRARAQTWATLLLGVAGPQPNDAVASPASLGFLRLLLVALSI